MMFRIGIISDTHGLLRPEAERRLAGVDHIVHAGDIGRPEIANTTKPVVLLWAVPAVIVVGGGIYLISHLH
jgi:uncharacterized protein